MDVSLLNAVNPVIALNQFVDSENVYRVSSPSFPPLNGLFYLVRGTDPNSPRGRKCAITVLVLFLTN